MLKTKKKAAAPENTALKRAKKAVTRYEQLNKERLEKQDAFEDGLTDSQKLLFNDIKETTDAVAASIEATKTLVREAGETVGPFLYQARFSTAGYDPKKVLHILCTLPPAECGNMLKQLYKRGAITAVLMDKDVAKILKAAEPDIEKELKTAWDPGGVAQTPAITTPKL